MSQPLSQLDVIEMILSACGCPNSWGELLDTLSVYADEWSIGEEAHDIGVKLDALDSAARKVVRVLERGMGVQVW